MCSAHQLSHKAARNDVLDFLIEVCNQSPMADDPEAWVEACSGAEYTAEDLQAALIDTRQFLESLRLYV